MHIHSWGRILAATGSIPQSLSSPLHPDKVSVTFVPSSSSPNATPLPVLVNGEPEKVDEVRASEKLALNEFEIVVDLGGGEESEVAKYWTCDFSYVSATISLGCRRY